MSFNTHGEFGPYLMLTCLNAIRPESGQPSEGDFSERLFENDSQIVTASVKKKQA